MTIWKRKMAEKARQNYGLSMDKAFKPTSNCRISATFAETKKFADALKKFDKQTSQHVKATKEFAHSTVTFLSTNVPRMHNESVPGQPEPEEDASLVGARVDLDKIKLAAQGGQENIHSYVQDPLRKWLSNFDTVVLAMHSVEQLRLLLDSRRRTLATLEGKLTNMKTKVDDDDPKYIKLVERKHRQEMKMSQVQEDFRAKEALTYQNMVHLVNDVKYVQQHLHKLFELHREVYADVCDAFPLTNSISDVCHDRPVSADLRSEAPTYPYGAVDADYAASHSHSDHGLGRGVAASSESHMEYGNRVRGLSSGHTFPESQVDGYSADPVRKAGSDRYAGVTDSLGYNPV